MDIRKSVAAIVSDQKRYIIIPRRTPESYDSPCNKAVSINTGIG